MPTISQFYGILIRMFYMENWNRCRRQEQPNSIEPLD